LFFSFRNTQQHKFSHVNKTFNIDIASISAPISNTISVNGICSSRSTASTSSTTSSSATDSQLDQTADDLYPNKQISNIKVTEDSEQIKKHNHQIYQLQQQHINENKFNNSSDMSDCSSISIDKFNNNNKNKRPINYDNLIGDRFVFNNNNQLVNYERHSFHENQQVDNNNKGTCCYGFSLKERFVIFSYIFLRNKFTH
jgi:hypothetical protein